MEALGVQSVCSHAAQGDRERMEDMHVVIYKREPDVGFLGVFDGHGGPEAAEYAKDHLWENIKRQRGFHSKDPQAVAEAIKLGFMRTQLEIREAVKGWPLRSPGLDTSTAGTTAVIAILKPDFMWIAHCGDSRAVLCQRGESAAVELTTDHKPEDAQERQRIERAGGKIGQGPLGEYRVCWTGPVAAKLLATKKQRRGSAPGLIGCLNMSRSLGNCWSFNEDTQEFIVSPEPDVRVHHRSAADRFLVLVTDGVTQVMSSQQMVDLINTKSDVKKRKSSPACLSQAVVQAALAKWHKSACNVADNITAVVLCFTGDSVTGCSAHQLPMR
eukprot:jgi/Chlat1/8464/Chrsp80S07870